LAALSDLPEVVVLDSGSTDETLTIAGQFPNVRVASRPFDAHAAQWNHGLTACDIDRQWVLALDADYVVTPALLHELAMLAPASNIAGYRTAFRYCVWGRPLSGSLYPAAVTLYRRAKAHYIQDGHTQRVIIDGEVQALKGHIRHDDRKPLARWLASQDRYAQLECELLLGKTWSALGWRDRLRRMKWVTPWLVPLYCLTVGKGLLDGRRGWYYALQRGIAEAVLSLKLFEAQWRAIGSTHDKPSRPDKRI
jgi:glycosyltransferase involved in cell wall biosynthesis